MRTRFIRSTSFPAHQKPPVAMPTAPCNPRIFRCVHVFLLLFVFLRSGVNALSPGDKCRNPDDQEGECIPITSCTLYIQMIKEKPLAEEKKKFLQRAQCGAQEKIPLLCCPFPGLANGSDVSRHPNWKLLPADTCGEEYSDYIFNEESGEEARITKFANVALLKYQTSDGQKFLCGGSVISDRYILTAAHCVATDEEKKLLGVRLGEHDLDDDPDCEKYADYEECNDPVQDMDIEEVIPHPQYQSSGDIRRHDIALIRLATAANLTDNVMAICLPNEHSLNKLYVDDSMFVAGWERAENRSINSVKLWAPLTLMSDEACSAIHERNFKLEENQMCARGLNKGACRGDSGGPLMVMDKGFSIKRGIYVTCVGILSTRSTNCTNNDIPSVYTRVAPYVEWILDNVKP